MRQSKTNTWVTEGRVAGLKPISTSPANIKYCSMIEKGIVDGILRFISTSTIITNLITTMIKYTIYRGRVAGLKRHISTSSITRRHFKTLVIRNNVTVTMMEGRMAGLLRPIPKTYITTNIKFICLAAVVCNLVDYPLIGIVPLSWYSQWHQGMNCIRSKVSI